MGLPSIIVTFKTLAASAIKRSQKGTLLVLMDEITNNARCEVKFATQLHCEASPLVPSGTLS